MRTAARIIPQLFVKSQYFVYSLPLDIDCGGEYNVSNKGKGVFCFMQKASLPLFDFKGKRILNTRDAGGGKCAERARPLPEDYRYRSERRCAEAWPFMRSAGFSA